MHPAKHATYATNETLLRPPENGSVSYPAEAVDNRDSGVDGGTVAVTIRLDRGMWDRFAALAERLPDGRVSDVVLRACWYYAAADGEVTARDPLTELVKELRSARASGWRAPRRLGKES